MTSKIKIFLLIIVFESEKIANISAIDKVGLFPKIKKYLIVLDFVFMV